VVRYIGMDVRREFAQLAVVEDGLLRDEGRIAVTPEALRRWVAELRPDDEVALEATGNSDAIANLLTPIVGRVVVSRGVGEGRVVGQPSSRAVAGVLPMDQGPPRLPNCRRCHGPQDDRACLAPGHQRPGLRPSPVLALSPTSAASSSLLPGRHRVAVPPDPRRGLQRQAKTQSGESDRRAS
jgi:hypothetical protein